MSALFQKLTVYVPRVEAAATSSRLSSLALYQPTCTSFLTKLAHPFSTTSPARVEICYRCGKPGHISIECTQSTKFTNPRDLDVCFRCGKPGHVSAACTQPKVCSSCGSNEHLRAACPDSRKVVPKCYLCGNSGHMKKDCPELKISRTRPFGSMRVPRRPTGSVQNE